MATIEELAELPWARELVPDGDGWFARIVKLRGCFATGDSKEKALQNLEAALRDWLAITLEQGETIPQPRGFDRQFSGRFSVRIPKSLHCRLAERAEEDDCSLNQWVVVALSRAVGV